MERADYGRGSARLRWETPRNFCGIENAVGDRAVCPGLRREKLILPPGDVRAGLESFWDPLSVAVSPHVWGDRRDIQFFRRLQTGLRCGTVRAVAVERRALRYCQRHIVAFAAFRFFSSYVALDTGYPQVGR